MPEKDLTAQEKFILELIRKLYAEGKKVKVMDLVKLMDKEKGMGKRQVVEAVIGLERKGLIKLADRYETRAEEEEIEYPREILELKEKIERLKHLIIKKG